MTIDLQRFCANDLDPREYLRAPWRDGAWVYATNGHLALRVAYTDQAVAERTDKHPDVGAKFKRTMEDRPCDFLLMPAVPELVACFDCEGKTKVRAIKCPDCTEGEFQHGHYTYTCLNCDRSPAGAGWQWLTEDDDTQPHEVSRTCEHCDGLGFQLRQNGGMQIGDAVYNKVYLAMLAALPQVRICPGDPARTNFDAPRETPAAFIFDGGHALLMPFKE